MRTETVKVVKQRTETLKPQQDDVKFVLWAANLKEAGSIHPKIKKEYHSNWPWKAKGQRFNT